MTKEEYKTFLTKIMRAKLEAFGIEMKRCEVSVTELNGDYIGTMSVSFNAPRVPENLDIDAEIKDVDEMPDEEYLEGGYPQKTAVVTKEPEVRDVRELLR